MILRTVVFSLPLPPISSCADPECFVRGGSNLNIFFVFYTYIFLNVFIPMLFLKRSGYCNRLRPSVRQSVRPSVRPLCYLLLNHWTIFNQIWCVSYSHELCEQQQFFLAPPSRDLGRGQKVKYHFISITKSISKIFIPNFVCFLTNGISLGQLQSVFFNQKF